MSHHTYLKSIGPAHSVDQVIERVEEVIEAAREHNSRIGYFAALYLQVARKFKESVESGIFQHPDLIDGLDVVFMNRYLEAIRQYQEGKTPSPPWEQAFRAGESNRPTVLQHLMLGMNAHINYDLSIAISQACPAQDMPRLRPDFETMNGVLFSLLREVEEELARIWPLLRTFHRFFGKIEDAIIKEGMVEARHLAWERAAELVHSQPQEQEAITHRLGREVARLGHVIWKPGVLLGSMLAAVRAGEPRSARQIIDILDDSFTRLAKLQPVGA